jgi:hypothetical protein
MQGTNHRTALPGRLSHLDQARLVKSGNGRRRGAFRRALARILRGAIFAAVCQIGNGTGRYPFAGPLSDERRSFYFANAR